MRFHNVFNRFHNVFHNFILYACIFKQIKLNEWQSVTEVVRFYGIIVWDQGIEAQMDLLPEGMLRSLQKLGIFYCKRKT